MTALCVYNERAKMLYLVRYNIIKQDSTRYLIKFKSGGTKWYAKDRFTDEQPIVKKPIVLKIAKEQPNFILF